MADHPIQQLGGGCYTAAGRTDTEIEFLQKATSAVLTEYRRVFR